MLYFIGGLCVMDNGIPVMGANRGKRILVIGGFGGVKGFFKKNRLAVRLSGERGVNIPVRARRLVRRISRHPRIFAPWCRVPSFSPQLPGRIRES